MKLLDYQSEWSTDCHIDESRLGSESTSIPKLHSKYMNYLSNERIKLKKLGLKKKKLTEQLEDYYGGKIDGRDIGREPWQHTETKSSIEKRIENDSEIIKVTLLSYEVEENILFLKEVIVNINQRNFQIKNHIDWAKFQNGGF